MIVAGIDPGMSGSLAIEYGDGNVHCYDVPMTKKGKKEVPAWTQWGINWCAAVEFAGPGLVVIELVGSMPGQGLSSTFKFGRSLGFIHAIATTAGCRIEFVTPGVWKAKLGLIGADKNASREKFRTLWPQHAGLVSRVKDDGRAEAALLAYYGRKFLL